MQNTRNTPPTHLDQHDLVGISDEEVEYLSEKSRILLSGYEGVLMPDLSLLRFDDVVEVVSRSEVEETDAEADCV